MSLFDIRHCQSKFLDDKNDSNRWTRNDMSFFTKNFIHFGLLGFPQPNRYFSLTPPHAVRYVDRLRIEKPPERESAKAKKKKMSSGEPKSGGVGGGGGGGFRARMDHYLYSGDKKHVAAGIAIISIVFGIPWVLMNRGSKHQSHQDYLEKADKARSQRLSSGSPSAK